MSAPEESLNGRDPDYVSAASNDQTQQKIYEENARSTTAKKITAIVEKEFSQEIDLKEKEVLQIQERLHKTLKIFHLLRYVVITNFYDRKQCQIVQTPETTKQTRIHPAVKTVLGKSPRSTGSLDLAVPSTSTDPRFLCNDGPLVNASTTTNNTLKIEENDDTSRSEKRKTPLVEESQPRKIPRYVPPKNTVPEKTCPPRGNSNKVRKRIIVGNISKWIPPDWREDASSHKWTMYVRGEKDKNVNIDTFISKVRFFLHPSYRPNDVVEVTSYPFHLSRRGWGEFPLRVQLHFKNALNKPMDIIHHLKLDRTYTGLQTLGSETLVDVWIRTTESDNVELNNDESAESSANDTIVKIEPNDDSYSKFTPEQSKKVSKTSHLTADTPEGIQMEEKIMKVYNRLNSSLDLMLMNNVEKVKIKTKCEDATQISDDKDKEMTDLFIEHDHNYCRKQYFNSDYCTIKEENVTVEHYSENTENPDCTTFAIDSSTIENNEKKSDLIANTFQEKNSQKGPRSFDAVKSLQENLKNDTKILENISTKDTESTTNGFCKPVLTSFDCFDNLQKSSHLKAPNSYLKPLHISIPSSNIFTSSNNKHVLLLKDKKSVPVNLTNILPSKPNENSKMFVEGVSILKKPPIAKVNALRENTVKNKNNNSGNKKTAVLRLKSANSLLLNVNENVPILKITDSRDPLYNYNLVDARRNLLIKKQEHVSCAKPEEKPAVQHVKVTLGKDKLKIQSKKDLYEAVLKSITTANIADTETLIRFVIRRLPIVTRDARDPDYKRLHPYACSSEEDYLAYNIGKQRAIEWYRAKAVRSFLRMKPMIPIDQLWSIKEIVLWARLHGYTPIKNIFNVQEIAETSSAKKLSDTTMSATISSTCTEPIALQKWLETCQQEPDRSTDCYLDNEEIDVETVEEKPCKITIDREKSDDNKTYLTGSSLIPIELDEKMLPFHNFVCDTARDIGIKIEPEEIIPGVLYCASSRVIMRVKIIFLYYKLHLLLG
ncbi:hypothetical protein PUN28_013018 [Cardiocondyla obscurior]|uniref:YEATS domain-containing protein n=1 Tax=Cardiocondyla obscurior TaxID=286306 RepID=A0AAW2F9T3_9HYME